MRRAKLGLAALGVALLALWPGAATAHIAIVLLIRSPADGQHMGRNVSIVVVAQPALAGVNHTAFTAELDGRPVDPASGRITSESRSAVIKVGSTTTIPLRGLASGTHRFVIRYRADTDEPVTEKAVSLIVARSHGPRWWLVAASSAALLVVVAASAALVRRTRSGRSRRQHDRP